MKAQLRNQIAAIFLLLPAATALVALPTAAVAQPARAEVKSLQVASDGGLSPGAQLQFTVEATPRAQTQLGIVGVRKPIVLKETSRGVYTGTYSIKRQDRITERSAIRAMVRVRNRNVVANYTFPAGIANATAASAPLTLKIDRFSVVPVDKMEPGAELRFALTGMAGGTAEFSIPGVVDNVAMREVRPGVYEGAYTIRRLDNFTPSRPIVATLRQGDRMVRANLTQALTQDAKAPTVINLSPREGEVVSGTTATSISASFEDVGGVGVDPKTVRVMVSGRNVTANSNITPQFIAYRGDLAPGRQTVEVSARDLAGNAVSKTWSFNVANRAAAVPTTVPLQVTSHTNNAIVEGGSTTVRGRTAPGAVVDVKVYAVAPVVGMFGVAQDVFSERIQADANGDFTFSFSPRFPLPGTRYELTMVSNKADLKAESKLVLFQKQG